MIFFLLAIMRAHADITTFTAEVFTTSDCSGDPVKTYAETGVPENTCANVDGGNERAILTCYGTSSAIFETYGTAEDCTSSYTMRKTLSIDECISDDAGQFYKLTALEGCDGTEGVNIDYLGVYPGSSGSGYIGAAQVAFNMSHATILYSGLQGDSTCDTGPTASSNSCGIHIHLGLSCEDSSLPGGHYYGGSVSSDPWTSVVYSASNGRVVVDFGTSVDAVNNRVLVLHNSQGDRVTCAQISTGIPVQSTVTVSDLGAYPGSSETAYTGTVIVSMVDSKVTLGYTGLTGDSGCDDGPSDAGNSCGIHIHSGTSCEDSSLPGGHYHGGSVSSDPWTDVVYKGASGTVTVDVGTTPADTISRVLVLHNEAGARITCMEISSGNVDSGSVTISDLGSYPGSSVDAYTGSAIVSMSGTSVTIEYNGLSGDPTCDDGPSDDANSCGLHIHLGNSCDDSSLPGGHYYGGDITSDPWTDVVYSGSEGAVTVNVGTSPSAINNRVLVLHNKAGGRVTCARVAIGNPETAVVSITDLGIYPGSSGSGFEGSSMVSYVDNKVTIGYTGLVGDAECDNGPREGIANSCGIHIHSGTSCEDASLPGGHYYGGSVSTDPWTDVVYSGSSGTVTVDMGTSPSDVDNRVLVLHNADGSRATCMRVSSGTPSVGLVEISDLGTYPGQSDTYVGTVMVSIVDNKVTLGYSGLSGDSACENGPTSDGNSCGLHIHSGNSCEDTSLPGGHYYGGSVYTDPWTNVVYKDASGTVTVDMGTSLDAVNNRVLVLHDSTGARQTCMRIDVGSAPTTAMYDITELGAYPGTDATYAGSAKISFTDNKVTIGFTGLEGDAACANGPVDDTPNSCGIHLHQGDCDSAADVGGHYYGGDVTSDPWTNVVYSGSSGTVTVDYGLSPSDAAGRSLVVHNSAGDRVTCAKYGESSSAMTFSLMIFGIITALFNL